MLHKAGKMYTEGGPDGTCTRMLGRAAASKAAVSASSTTGPQSRKRTAGFGFMGDSAPVVLSFHLASVSSAVPLAFTTAAIPLKKAWIRSGSQVAISATSALMLKLR